MRWLLVAPLMGMVTGQPNCSRQNPTYCAPDVACPEGQRCQVSPGLSTGEGTCVPSSGDGGASCAGPASCEQAEQPICDARERVCRACQDGEDASCKEWSGGDKPRCQGGRCVQCAVPSGKGPAQVAECTARGAPRPGQAPICDQGRCRPCQRHDECASGVCVKDDTDLRYDLQPGSCVPAEQVLAVSTASCSPTGPVFCSPREAIKQLGKIASGNIKYRYLVFQRGPSDGGDDFSQLDIGQDRDQENEELHLINAALADDPPALQTRPLTLRGVIGAPMRPGFVIRNNVHVHLEGFVIQGGTMGIDCAGAQDTQVRVQRSYFFGNRMAALTISSGCQLRLEDSWIGRRVGADGTEMPPNQSPALVVNRGDFRIYNTVINGNGNTFATPQAGFGGIQIFAGLAGKSFSLIANTLFYESQVSFQSTSAVWCENPTDLLVLLNNSYLQGTQLAPTVAAVSSKCGDRIFGAFSDDTSSMAVTQRAQMVNGMSSGFKVDKGVQLGLDRSFIPRGAEPQNAAQRALRELGVSEVEVQSMNGAIKEKLQAPPRDHSGAERPGADGKISIGPFEPQP